MLIMFTQESRRSIGGSGVLPFASFNSSFYTKNNSFSDLYIGNFCPVGSAYSVSYKQKTYGHSLTVQTKYAVYNPNNFPLLTRSAEAILQALIMIRSSIRLSFTSPLPVWGGITAGILTLFLNTKYNTSFQIHYFKYQILLISKKNYCLSEDY